MTFKFKNHEIELYSSAHSLPILRFQKFNKYQMIDSEIGSTFEDFVLRTRKAVAFIEKGMIAEAKQELNNRLQTAFNCLNEKTPKGRAFAVLVRRIDGVRYESFAPDDLDQILLHLNDIGFDADTSVEKLREVKKKSNWNFRRIIPSIFRGLRIPRFSRFATTGHSQGSTA